MSGAMLKQLGCAASSVVHICPATRLPCDVRTAPCQACSRYSKASVLQRPGK